MRFSVPDPVPKRGAQNPPDPDSGLFRIPVPEPDSGPDYSGYQYFPVTVKTASIRNVNLSQVRCHFTLELKN
jgi:hypothetical protein